MPLGVNNPIVAADINAILVTKPGVVYRLTGFAHDSVIVKFEVGDESRFRLQKKFVNVLDPQNVKLRVLKPAELQAIYSKLLVPPTIGVRGGGPVPPPPIVQALSATPGLRGGTELDVLKHLIDDAQHARAIGVKMAYVANLETMGAFYDNPPTARSTARQAAFLTVFFDPYNPNNPQPAWEKLGKIAAVDLFIGNKDRFNPGSPERNFKAIRNLDNHMFVGNQPIGLDTFDPNASTAGDLANPIPMKDIQNWSGLLLQASNGSGRNQFAAKVVQDYKTLAGLATVAAPQADAVYEQWFKNGLMLGRTQILNRIAAIQQKRPNNPLAQGLAWRQQVLNN